MYYNQYNQQCAKKDENRDLMLARMLDEELFTDFTLKAGDLEIKVHKAVLAARSPVFPDHGVVEMQNVEPETLEQLVSYLYCVSIEKEEGLVQDLLQLADMYGIEDLKSECENILLLTVNENNACENALLADSFDCAPLRERAIEIIASSPNITKTEGWYEFVRKPDLVTKAFEMRDVKNSLEDDFC
ncbi:unnamed protein product [Caenorhabditis auriculariae]|uniref:BTB domain-containing protein n=1 Tax=Caenorhabditis auriculariae TaxID=2777116 RepID=A0A8S1GSC7_9PELO|nr:unnamed protein product [Caenorhabditis auriculariae]